MAAPIVRFQSVSIVFGDGDKTATLAAMDQGRARAEIQRETGQILGVHDCSLDVAEGEIAVLMGLSGSGKSTLLRAVNGLNPVARGALLVHDGDDFVDMAQADAATLRRMRRARISMVFQQFGLLPWRSVLDNVALGLELAGRPAGECRERALAQLETVQLQDWAERRVDELSGGMQQRVGLARAFATEAPILLMDEPFSALDPLIRNDLQDELLELQQRLRRTIIFVSHDLDEAVKLGSHIAILEGGRIAQAGTPEQIVLRPENDYVADFVAHMNPLNVLCAGDVAVPADGAAPEGARRVAADRPVRELIGLLSDDPSPLVLESDAGARIAPEDIVRALHRR